MKKNSPIFIIFIATFVIISGFLPVTTSECDCGHSATSSQKTSTYPTGLIVPENWWESATFDPCNPRGELPEQFDWRDIEGVDYTTPIKSQGSCGSCWAFGTVGPLECNIKIKDGIEVDLSEQYLVSCNSNGWDCGGGWWAHDYHEWKPDYCGGVGAVLEQYFPYEASDLPCNCPYPHNYLIEDWAFIGSQYGIPPVANIKQAIMDYGPVSVAVCVNSAFHDYDGGIFSGPTCTNINHAVVLVGWDDTQGDDGVWFLRNSWGTGWGEGGYMRIEYGVCKVGYAACFVEYLGSALKFNFPEGKPSELIPGEPTAITLQIEEEYDTYVLGTATLYYRYDGEDFVSKPLTVIGETLFEAVLPSSAYGDEPEYYFSAEGTQTGIIYSPFTAPDQVYHASIAEPKYNITIRGGLFVNAKIQNDGLVDAEDMVCNLSVEGGLLNHINEFDEDHIISLDQDERKTIRLNKVLFGLGKIDIKLELDAANSGRVIRHADAIVFFGLVVVLGQ